MAFHTRAWLYFLVSRCSVVAIQALDLPNNPQVPLPNTAELLRLHSWDPQALAYWTPTVRSLGPPCSLYEHPVL